VRVNRNEYVGHDALGLAELVRTRQVDASELLDAALARADAVQPSLNAVVTRLDDAARAGIAAGLPPGPLRGVPFLVKELVASVAGAATTAASRLYAGNVAARDSEVVARYRRAGLVIFGKTNSPEFGLSPATESHLYGVTRNPWRLDLAPGGSSGGSAAAVAAGVVPAAHATDGGGSIRIPASCCGLFGLKPTRARITAGPEGGEGLSGLAVQHVVSRSVRDSAALLDATHGALPGDPYGAPPPTRPYLAEVGAAPGVLRIAFARSAPNGAAVAADCVAAVEDAARLCESLGHRVEEASPECDWSALTRDFVRVFAANVMANIARATGGALPAPGLVEPLTFAIAERGRAMAAFEFIGALHNLHRQARAIAGFFERHDVWLTPTLASPPLPIGWFDIDSPDVDAWIERLVAFLPFTYPFNVTGQPAASVPLFWNAAGLPIGVQFAARSGDEALLFRLAAQLEQARPWFGRRPPHC
jgi:Asp-tRNA(Asn)/Glu-tRNA(Gln) amidotransferase A subunit family amidase